MDTKNPPPSSWPRAGAGNKAGWRCRRLRISTELTGQGGLGKGRPASEFQQGALETHTGWAVVDVRLAGKRNSYQDCGQ